MTKVQGKRLTFKYAGNVRNYVQMRRSQMISSHEEIVVVEWVCVCTCVYLCVHVRSVLSLSQRVILVLCCVVLYIKFWKSSIFFLQYTCVNVSLNNVFVRNTVHRTTFVPLCNVNCNVCVCMWCAGSVENHHQLIAIWVCISIKVSNNRLQTLVKNCFWADDIKKKKELQYNYYLWLFPCTLFLSVLSSKLESSFICHTVILYMCIIVILTFPALYTIFEQEFDIHKNYIIIFLTCNKEPV